jgi:hypothetical protein
MVKPTADEERTAELTARIAALEQALERRSRELRALVLTLEAHDLENLTRIKTGLAPLPRWPFHPRTWRESTALRPARVLPVLRTLWAATPRDRG